MRVFGYVRVSSKDQNEDRQVIALRQLGVPKENIYMDKMSGKDLLNHSCLGLFIRCHSCFLINPLHATQIK